MRRRLLSALPASLGLALVTACGTDASTGAAADSGGGQLDDALVVYSGRDPELVGDLLDGFTEETGIPIQVRFGSTAAMAATVLEEGDRSPADVFFGQDVNALGALAEADLLAELPAEVTAAVPAGYVGDDDAWIGTSARVRVLVYHRDLVPEAELPASVLDLTDPEWAGRVGVAPTNAGFRVFVAGLREELGDDAALAWMEGIAQNGNEAHVRSGNGGIVDAVEAGDTAVGLVNHYYLGEAAAEAGGFDQLSSALHFFGPGDPGGLVNLAGAGVLASSDKQAQAAEFVAWLVSTDSQQYFVEQTHEYPVVAGVPGPEGFPALDSLVPPDVDLDDLGDLEGTVALIERSGLVGLVPAS